MLDEAAIVVEGRDIRSGVAMHHLRSLRRGEVAVQEEPVAGGLKSATAYTSSEGCPPSHRPSPGNSSPRGRRDRTYISRNKSTQKQNPATTTNVAGPGPDNSTLCLVGNRLTRRKLQGTSGPKQGRLGDWKEIQFEHGMEGGSGYPQTLRPNIGGCSPHHRPQGHLAKRAAHKRFKGHRVG